MDKPDKKTWQVASGTTGNNKGTVPFVQKIDPSVQWGDDKIVKFGSCRLTPKYSGQPKDGWDITDVLKNKINRLGTYS